MFWRWRVNGSIQQYTRGIKKTYSIINFKQNKDQDTYISGTIIKADILYTPTYTDILFYKSIPLYIYAKGNNQIDRQPIEILNLPIRRDNDVWELEAFLRRRIKAMETARQPFSKNITFDSLYEVMKVRDTKDARKKARDKIFSFLDHYKKVGRIENYIINKKGKTLHSITIELKGE